MNNIIYHDPKQRVNTFPSTLNSGTVNPLQRTSYKQTININSRFRDNYTITPASEFYFNIPQQIDKIVSMKLDKIIIPKFIYTVNSNTGSDNFGIFFKGINSTPDIDKRLYLPSGSYSNDTIIKTINGLLDYTVSLDPTNNSGLKHIRSRYDTINGKICFDISWNNLPNYDLVDLCFNYINPQEKNNFIDISSCYSNWSCNNSHIYSEVGSNVFKDQLTLGWLLGFRGNYKYNTPKNIVKNNCLPNYSFNENIKYSYRFIKPTNLSPPTPVGWCYCAESIYDPLGNRYFLLSVNDFKNHHNRSFISPMQEESLHDGNILAKVYGACGGECCCENQYRIYFGPTNISRLHIKLLDEFGRIVDLNNGDYSFTLELEILYDL